MNKKSNETGYARALRQFLKATKTVSFETLAQDARLSVKTLGNWASGDHCPDRDNALRALRALGLSADEAVERDNSLREEFGVPIEPSSDPIDPPDQPFLQAPPRATAVAHYASRALPLLGRGAELARLRAFVDSADPFLWLQISGEGGQGKSRLALELMRLLRPAWMAADTAPDDWSAGFLMDSDIDRFGDRWETWCPARPTLLVADYVVGRGDTLGPVLRTLSRRRLEFRHPVRILFLERQPWNSVGGLQITSDRRASRRPGRAEWFVALCDRHDGADPIVADARYEDGLVHLRGLEARHLTAIVRSAAALSKFDCGRLGDEAIIERLGRIDASGRPLYALLYGEALAEGLGDLWTNIDVLNAVLDRDWSQRWARCGLDEEMPAFGDDHPAMRLALLATMCERVELTDGSTLAPDLRVTARHRYLAAVITESLERSLLDTRHVDGLEPDILGEWFVLRCLKGGLIDYERLLAVAWQLDPAAMARFVLRISRDFLEDAMTLRIIACAP